VIIAVTAVIRKGRRILVGLRAANESAFPGLWALPGGKLEPGETVEDGLKREVREEVGLQVTGTPVFLRSFCFTHPRHQTPVLGLSFAVEATGAVQLSDEFSAHRWVTPEDLVMLPCIPGLVDELAVPVPPTHIVINALSGKEIMARREDIVAAVQQALRSGQAEDLRHELNVGHA